MDGHPLAGWPKDGRTGVERARLGAACEGIPRRPGQPTPTWGRDPIPLPILERLAPIGLAEMDAVALMDRVDVKYVLSAAQLPCLLAALTTGYRVLEVGGIRLNRYRTLYFDTPDLALYADHQRGKAERYKVRSRCYLDSGVTYLEVKRRTNHGRTIKDRIATAALVTELTAEGSQFVDRVVPGDARPLQPALWNDFSRITLVSLHRLERVTLDVQLSYRAGERRLLLPGLVVAEVKQERMDRDSELMRAMRVLAVRPTPFSKYCVGTALLRPEVKHNRFQPILRRVEKALRGDHDL